MILLLNATICFFIAIRLFLFKRCENSYKFTYAILAWLLICASASVTVLILFHEVEQAQIAQMIMNFIILVCVMKAKGNIAQLTYSLLIPKKTYLVLNNKKVKQS